MLTSLLTLSITHIDYFIRSSILLHRFSLIIIILSFKLEIFRAVKAAGHEFPPLEWNNRITSLNFVIFLQKRVDRDLNAWPKTTQGSQTEIIQQSENYALGLLNYQQLWTVIFRSQIILTKYHYEQLLRRKIIKLRGRYNRENFFYKNKYIRRRLAEVFDKIKFQISNKDSDISNEKEELSIKKGKEVANTITNSKNISMINENNIKDAKKKWKDNDKINDKITKRQHHLT